MRVICNLSCPHEHPTSAIPAALNDIHSKNDPEGLLKLLDAGNLVNSVDGFVCIMGSERADVVAWLDLLQDFYPDIEPEVKTLKRHIRSEFIRSPLTNTFGVRLKDINRQHGYDGKLIQRGWFWKPEDEVHG